jgi:hypothetical protein
MKKNINEVIDDVVKLYIDEAMNYNVPNNGQPNYAYLSGLFQGMIQALPDTKENRNFLESVAYRTTFVK